MPDRTWEVPAFVAEAAARGLDLRASLPASQRAGTATGIARARDLANRRPISDETAIRIYNFFSRNLRAYRAAPGWGVDSKAWQAALLWGGPRAWGWIRPIADQILRGQR